MAKNEIEKIGVLLVDAVGPSYEIDSIHELAQFMNGLQSRVEIVTGRNRAHALKVTLLYGNETQPYYTWPPPTESDKSAKNSIAIDLLFHERHSAAVPLPAYISYFVSIIVLEYLSREWEGQELLILKRQEYSQTRDLVWRGTVTQSAESAVGRLKGSPESPTRMPILEAVEKLRDAGRQISYLMGDRAREVADCLSIHDLQTEQDIYGLVIKHFYAVGPDQAESLAAQFRRDDREAIPQLVDQIQSYPTASGIELLKGLADAKNLGYETKDYAKKALDELTAGGLLRLESVEQFSVTTTSDAASSGASTAGPEVATTTESAEIKAEAVIESIRSGRFGVHSDNVTARDVLGYGDYARALAQVITDSKTQPPLTIGICAPWGRGKTTLMNLIESEIELINRQVMNSWTPLDLDYRRTISIKFDSWRYSKAEHVWAGFIDTVLRELQKGFEGWWRKLRLAFMLNRKNDLPLIHQLAVFSIAAITSLVVAIAYMGDYKAAGIAAWAIAMMTLYRKFLAGAWKMASSPITERIVQLTRLPNYRTRLDPIHQIKEDIEFVAREYSKNPLKGSVRRFVVFVDDIDRCGPEQIMDTLEAIKHFLDLDQFVFVIAMDARVVRHAIGKHYKFMGEGTHQREEMGRFYLEKMIQIPFTLPPVGGERLKDLNNVLLQDYLGDDSEDSIPKDPEPEPSLDETITVDSTPEKENVTDEGLNGDEDDLDTDIEPSTNEKTPNPTPEVSDELSKKRVRITAEEKRIIDGILESPLIEMSPRLFKRFINIYMIARYLHFEHLKQLGKDEKLPPADLLKWLALSVIFPFEAKALLQWWEENEWGNPFTDIRAPFDSDGDFRLIGPDIDPSIQRKLPHTSTMFGGLDWPQLNAFGRALSLLEVDYTIVRDTRHITDCFNLVLD